MVAAMLFAGLFTYCYGQDVRVNINNQDYSSNKDCEYRINGICSSEDIGGVEIQGKIKWDFESNVDAYYKCLYAVLKNYNPFTVTVLFEYDYNNVQSLVLQANGTKEVYIRCVEPAVQYRNPEPSTNTSFTIKGMIVRKVGQ